MRIILGRNKVKELEEKINNMEKKLQSPVLETQALNLDVVNDETKPKEKPFDKKGYSDIGRGIVIPTVGVRRGIQRLSEAKPSLFDLIVKILSIGTFALAIIILIVNHGG